MLCFAQFRDIDDSESLEAGELLCTLNLFCYGSTQEKIRLCFEAFDDDKSGELDLEEFCTMIETTLLKSRAVFEELMGAFVPEDLDWEECEKITLMSLNEYDVRNIAMAAFEDCDADGSGAIDFKEFENWALSR